MGQDNKNSNGAPRYSLIIETVDGKKYFYTDKKDGGVFVLQYDGMKVAKTTLPALDYLTSNFQNKEDLGLFYGITDPIRIVYITYVHDGTKLLAPIFNNKEWAHVASTYIPGKGVDYKDNDNLSLFNDVYGEIADLDSDFATTLLKNNQRLINLSPKTRDTIICLRAHENAIKMKSLYGGFAARDIGTYNRISEIYVGDHYGYYEDLKKRLTKYREFRTVYMNYCKFKNVKDKTDENTMDVDKPMRKVIIPPKQMSIYDEMDD